MSNTGMMAAYLLRLKEKSLMVELQGYCHPLSPQGKAAMIGDLPWHFSSSLMHIHFKTDKEAIRKLLPEPYELSTQEPDGAIVWFGDFLSVWNDARDMVYINPERTQYRECILIVRCRCNGVEGLRAVYNWVDNDFTMLRGWFYGFPKKLGNIILTQRSVHLHQLNRGVDDFGPGTSLKALCSAHGETLITGAVTLGKKIPPSSLEPPFGLPWFNILHFPSTDVDSKKPLVHQIIQTITEPPIFGDVWEGSEASLVFARSEIEEHYDIEPYDIVRSYFMNIGLTFNGTRVIHQY